MGFSSKTKQQFEKTVVNAFRMSLSSKKFTAIRCNCEEIWKLSAKFRETTIILTVDFGCFQSAFYRQCQVAYDDRQDGDHPNNWEWHIEKV